MNKFDGYESGCMTDTFLLTSYATSAHPLSSPWAMAGCAEENRERHSSNATWDLQAWERRTGGGGQRETPLKIKRLDKLKLRYREWIQIW